MKIAHERIFLISSLISHFGFTINDAVGCTHYGERTKYYILIINVQSGL